MKELMSRLQRAQWLRSLWQYSRCRNRTIVDANSRAEKHFAGEKGALARKKQARTIHPKLRLEGGRETDWKQARHIKSVVGVVPVVLHKDAHYWNEHVLRKGVGLHFDMWQCRLPPKVIASVAQCQHRSWDRNVALWNEGQDPELYAIMHVGMYPSVSAALLQQRFRHVPRSKGEGSRRALPAKGEPQRCEIVGFRLSPRRYQARHPGACAASATTLHIFFQSKRDVRYALIESNSGNHSPKAVSSVFSGNPMMSSSD
eukprot:5067756-Amphidinium_carterae.1